LEARLLEEGFERFTVCVRRGGADAGERQVRELLREGFDQAAHLILLLRVELLQLFGHRPVRFGGGDALERATQLRELRADCA
jgi:hypothetical protein